MSKDTKKLIRLLEQLNEQQAETNRMLEDCRGILSVALALGFPGNPELLKWIGLADEYAELSQRAGIQATRKGYSRLGLGDLDSNSLDQLRKMAGLSDR